MTKPYDYGRLSRPALRSGNGKREAKATGWAGGIRALYDDVSREPLPPEFAKLLDELKQQGRT